jgi:serine phosphatase RsbU (regulator of sigma subunit)
LKRKQNDILDSIKYAERIQTAILPTDETLNNIFDGEHFVLYKPKDIVSGDFYWADRFGSEAIFAAVDCTGHGVPGAFVSIVGFNGLNRTVNEFDLRKPGEILDKLADLVVGTFAKSESQIKDGMDIALCNINYETQTLTYSGANNPLIIIRDGELIETKANKQPIGEFHNRVPFTTHEFKLQKGDCVYVFSDGYADQFGGEKGKKFKGKALKQLLLEISKFNMTEQRTKLDEAFEIWKGDFEQLDDVCLFGVKI